MSSTGKRCNSQDIFLTKETKEARSFDTQRRESSAKGGLRGWGEDDSLRGYYDAGKGKDKGGLRGWEDDYGPPRGKGKGWTVEQPVWEDGFAAGYAAASGKGKGYGRDYYMRERSRSPAGRWGHDLWVNEGGSPKGYSKGKNGAYSNFGGQGKGGKNGKGGKDGKNGKGGKKGRGKDKGRNEEPPDATMLDADLDKYFGKEPVAAAKGGKPTKDSKEAATELDSQLSAYFGEAKPKENGAADSREAEPEKAPQPEEAASKEKAAEAPAS